ncbi:MAG: hypothetical protein QM731_09880 [Chitinophagaceae bacterium]
MEWFKRFFLIFLFIVIVIICQGQGLTVDELNTKNENIFNRFNELMKMEFSNHEDVAVVGYLLLGKGKQRGCIIWQQGAKIRKVNILYKMNRFVKNKAIVIKDAGKNLLDEYFSSDNNPLNDFLIDTLCNDWSEGVYGYILARRNKMQTESLLFPQSCMSINRDTFSGQVIKELMSLTRN